MKEYFIIAILLCVGFLFLIRNDSGTFQTAEASKNIFIWKKLLIIGDSNTQLGFDRENEAWVGLLANALQRKCDVINRGFSGFTTHTIINILPKIMSEYEQHIEQIVGVVILLGTNDAAKRKDLYVPLDKYEENYEWILNYLIDLGIKKENIIIMTPFKIIDAEWAKVTNSEHADESVKNYVIKCKEIALRNQISYIDLYSLMENSKTDYRSYLRDGLHLSTTGGYFVFEHLWPLIDQKFIATQKLKIYFLS